MFSFFTDTLYHSNARRYIRKLNKIYTLNSSYTSSVNIFSIERGRSKSSRWEMGKYSLKAFFKVKKTVHQMFNSYTIFT